MKPSDHAIVILMADDDEDDRLLTADALRESKVANELKTVGDGEQLMDYLHHRGKYAPPASSPRPGLVLLDLNMPRKDGREALREMKADPALRSIPVVILTTSQTEYEIERAYDLGANSFIAKPVTFDGLVEALRVATEYWLQIVHLPPGTEDYHNGRT
jgi:CheY-like chemotaxis protein